MAENELIRWIILLDEPNAWIERDANGIDWHTDVAAYKGVIYDKTVFHVISELRLFI